MLKLELSWDSLPTEIADRVDTYVSALHALPDSPRNDAIYDAYKFEFRIVLATCLAISVFILWLTLVFIKYADMNRKLASKHRLDSARVNKHWGRRSTEGEEGV